jgi:hypothetical protein
MNKKDKALQMAIECLEYHFEQGAWGGDLEGIIHTCKEALEQPAQSEYMVNEGGTGTVLRKQPAQDYVLICKRCGDDLGIEYVPDKQPAMTYEQGFAHGYEAHRAEQALEQPAQEPVEVYGILDDGNYVSVEATKEGAIKHCEFMNKHDCNCTYKPLYTHPHQWQGLTDDEVNNIYPCAEGVHDFRDIVRAIEQALKEKNHVS